MTTLEEGSAAVADESKYNNELAETKRKARGCGKMKRIFLFLSRFLVSLWSLIIANAVLLGVLVTLAASMHIGIMLFDDGDDNFDEANGSCIMKQDIRNVDILAGALESVCDCVREPLRAA